MFRVVFWIFALLVVTYFASGLFCGLLYLSWDLGRCFVYCGFEGLIY